MAFKNGITSYSQLVTYVLLQLLAKGVISSVNGQKAAYIDVDGEKQIVLGGLFPVHEEGLDGEKRCGRILLEKGVQRLEAMLYAIDQVNKNRNYDFKMGAVILDTCSSESYALEQSLQFLHYSCGPTANISRKVAAVVGASNSLVSVSVANVFRLFKIPQVSYASTSEELDDIHKYSYFFRVVPSDKFQVQVILDLLLEFGWTYVSMVISQGDYGEHAAQTLSKLIAQRDICIANTETLPRNASKQDYDKVVANLDLLSARARAVIVFLNEDKINELFKACERKEIPPGRFVWIGSDGWGTKERVVEGHEKIAEGAITILPKRYPIQGFDDYFTSLKPKSNTRNPWFEEFWENQFDCALTTETRRRKRLCTGFEDLKENYQQEGLVPMVIDSVNLLATAIQTTCNVNPGFCRGRRDVFSEKTEERYREKFLEIIKRTSFESSQGHGMEIRFDSSRSVPVNYSVSIFKKVSNYEEGFGYRVIGEWNPSKRLVLLRQPDWHLTGGVKSQCSDECPDGEERIRHSQTKPCCWDCRACPINSFLPDKTKSCQQCPEGTVPNSDKTACIEKQIKYVGQDFTSAWALVPLVFSILGLIATSTVLVIFFLNHKTPIIMASGRELCYFILVGIIVCYCYSFVALVEPSVVSCGALRIGMGLGLSICYSAIFTKTNRLSRIFEVSLKMIKRPSYISPESQIMICVCLVLIQVTLTVLWLIITTPDVPIEFVEAERAWVTYCQLDSISLLLGLVYNMFLLILCTIYAYKTRNIPENFNESKWISFTMYASCIIWLAFIPIYCSAVKDYKVQSVILAMSVSASGTVILACMFLPKIYIVIFHPERNVRYPTSSTGTNGTGTSGSGQPGPPVRFLRGASKNMDHLQSPSPTFNKGSGSPFLLRTNQLS